MDRFPRSVGIVGNPWYRHFYSDLAVRLKQQHCSVHLFVANQEAIGLFRSSDNGGVYDTVDVAPNQTTAPIPRAADCRDTFSRAQAFERQYRLTYNWLMVPDRLYGRGYAVGGYYHPRSVQSETASQLQATEIYNQLFEYWEQAFNRYRIEMLFEANSLQAAVAQSRGAVVRSATPARYLNRYYWTTDALGYCDDVERIFLSDTALADPTVTSEAPFQAGMTSREALGSFSILGVAKEVVAQTRNHTMWRLTGNQKARLYRYSDQVSLALRRRRDFHRVSGPETVRVSDLTGKPFVFYALHVEPEIWFQGRSPEYFVQLAAITSLSRDLPAGVVLAVKEHLPAIGRRPDLFYDQIKALKNVALVNVLESGPELVRQSVAVATICGTVGQEAAVAGKPVVTFGRHNLYNILEHVRLVAREEDLRSELHWAIFGSRDVTATAAAGRRFLASVVASSFDMGRFTYRDLRGYTEESVDTAVERLYASLAASGPPPVRTVAHAE